MFTAASILTLQSQTLQSLSGSSQPEEETLSADGKFHMERFWMFSLVNILHESMKAAAEQTSL